MTEYTFYRITHPDYPELVYIGSTKNYTTEKDGITSPVCYNENRNEYNKLLYQFIREQRNTI